MAKSWSEVQSLLKEEGFSDLKNITFAFVEKRSHSQEMGRQLRITSILKNGVLWIVKMSCAPTVENVGI